MSLIKLKNKHIGLGFVIGSGPSLQFQDLDFLSNYPSIAVNSAIAKARDATYFLSDDWAVSLWDYFYKLPKKTQALLYKDKVEKYSGHIPKDRLLFFDHKKDIEFTKDPLKPIIQARTSVGSAIHFGYIMGFDPIVLLGCDCCFLNGKRYYWQFSGQKKCRQIRGKNIIYPPNKRKDGYEMDNHTIDFLNYWDKLAKQAKKQNIKILNASGGILESFPRIKLKDLI